MFDYIALGCQTVVEYVLTPANFKNPFVLRKWLKLLTTDPISMIRIQPNLRLGKEALGFSFSSNSLGLRGPKARNADNVIFGTSYAMGFGVDNGANWYELCLEPSQWLNIALPVGPVQLRNLLLSLHLGRPRRGLVLYFANFFPYARQFDEFSKQHADCDAFEYFRWRHRYRDCTRVLCKLPFKVIQALNKGNMLLLKTERGIHLLDLNYGMISRQAHQELFAHAVATWRKLLQPFEIVDILRIPSKNEAVTGIVGAQGLDRQRACLDDNWYYFQSGLQHLPGVRFQDLSHCFDLDDFMLWDNHFNAQGNRKLAKHVAQTLNGGEESVA